jgi:hypothetical protein
MTLYCLDLDASVLMHLSRFLPAGLVDPVLFHGDYIKCTKDKTAHGPLSNVTSGVNNIKCTAPTFPSDNAMAIHSTRL